MVVFSFYFTLVHTNAYYISSVEFETQGDFN